MCVDIQTVLIVALAANIVGMLTILRVEHHSR